MTARTVLVSGASIAGPALAHWLGRYGWTTTVVERADALREEGQNIDVRGAAREVLRRMGLEDAALAATTGELGTEFVDDWGGAVATFPASQDETRGATAEMEILRGRLSRLIHDTTSDRTEHLFGDRIAALTEDGDGVAVTFASSATRRFDLVVIAEGATSRTRAMVFPGSPLRHLGMYCAYLTIPRTDDDTPWWRWHVALAGRGVTLRPDDVGTTRATLNFLSDTRGLDELDRTGQATVLRRVFADVGWEAPRVLAALDEAPFYVEDLAQVHLPRWSRGRVALVGDAAHCATPVSGLGTSLSLTGAYVLAGELATCSDHEAAFARYEEVMRPYVARGQKLPPGTPRLANPRSARGRAALQTVLRAAASPAAQRLGGLGERLFSPPADALDLPDYPAGAVLPAA